MGYTSLLLFKGLPSTRLIPVSQTVPFIKIASQGACTKACSLLFYFFHCRKLDRERKEQYQHQLNEMQERVQSRPLLLEQASQLSARRSAEAKYRATLKKAGLSDKEIQALEHK